MKNKMKLLTLLLATLFSYGFIHMVWADCTVTISPKDPTICAGDPIEIIVRTEGEGCLTPSYTWEVSQSDCTGGSIDENGRYSPGVPPSGECVCTETIKVTDTANGNAFEETTITVIDCDAIVVQIAGPSYIPVGESTCFTASTFCYGETLTGGTYTWKIDGVPVDANPCLGCMEDGPHTVTVTDTTYDVTANATITCQDTCYITCSQPDALSRWMPLPGIIAINGFLTEFKFGTRVDISCEVPWSVLKLGALVFPSNQTIQQLVLIMPSILLRFYLGDECETCTVSIINGGCDDTDLFEICP